MASVNLAAFVIAGTTERGAGSGRAATGRTLPRIRFAGDSPLEQSGFELWVPPACDAPGSHKVRC
jgi:hypothetical protein